MMKTLYIIVGIAGAFFVFSLGVLFGGSEARNRAEDFSFLNEECRRNTVELYDAYLASENKRAECLHALDYCAPVK